MPETIPQHPRHQALWAEIEPDLDSSDLAHDALHITRVYAWALKLAPEAGADPGVIYTVESSDDLLSWNSIGITITTNSAVMLEATYDTTGPVRRYLRVKVTVNP